MGLEEAHKTSDKIETDRLQNIVKELRKIDNYKIIGKNGQEMDVSPDFLIEYLDNLSKDISRRLGIMEDSIGNLSDLIIGKKKDRTLKYSVGRVTKKMRERILIRDNFTCQNCGVHGDFARLNVDHIFPRSQGGKAEPDNLQVLCKSCNLLKLNRIFNKKKSSSLNLKLTHQEDLK